MKQDAAELLVELLNKIYYDENKRGGLLHLTTIACADKLVFALNGTKDPFEGVKLSGAVTVSWDEMEGE